MSLRKGFTLIELLVVIAIIGILAGLVMPVLGRARELGRRAKCASNLHAVGRAMHLYASANDSEFPTVSPTGIDGHCIGIDRHLAEPRHGGRWKGTSRNLFLLARLKLVSESVFICPSSSHHVDPDLDPSQYYDFITWQNLSYSMRVQENNETSGYYGLATMITPSGVAFVADRNPISGEDSWQDLYGGYFANPTGDGSNAMKSGFDEEEAGSFNHDQEGHNVLSVNGTVSWQTEATVGLNGDNIWTWQNPTTGESETGVQDGTHPFRRATPTSDTDSFLFP